jgi:hypothetical protein
VTVVTVDHKAVLPKMVQRVYSDLLAPTEEVVVAMVALVLVQVMVALVVVLSVKEAPEVYQ